MRSTHAFLKKMNFRTYLVHFLSNARESSQLCSMDLMSTIISIYVLKVYGNCMDTDFNQFVQCFLVLLYRVAQETLPILNPYLRSLIMTQIGHFATRFLTKSKEMGTIWTSRFEDKSIHFIARYF